jgi:hypothetical protein
MDDDFDLAVSFAQRALTEDGPWAKFYFGMARFYWSRCEEGSR